MTNNTRIALLLLLLAQGVASCDPAGPSVVPSLSITAISPTLGSTGGATPLRITGSGFRPADQVTLGGTVVQARSDHRDPIGTILYLEAPAHPAGTVDVVVTNPNGQAVTLAGGYAYASPQSFDFNGKWSGFGNAGQDIPILFTIENGMLRSVECYTYTTLTFSTPPSVTNGEFSYSRDDSIAVSGRIVSASAAVGTLNLPPCSNTNWVASK